MKASSKYVPMTSSGLPPEGVLGMFSGGGMSTWRIIPFSKWLITMVSKSPKWGYSPSKWPFYSL